MMCVGGASYYFYHLFIFLEKEKNTARRYHQRQVCGMTSSLHHLPHVFIYLSFSLSHTHAHPLHCGTVELLAAALVPLLSRVQNTLPLISGTLSVLACPATPLLKERL